jgi:hypothetical protein
MSSVIHSFCIAEKPKKEEIPIGWKLSSGYKIEDQIVYFVLRNGTKPSTRSLVNYFNTEKKRLANAKAERIQTKRILNVVLPFIDV